MKAKPTPDADALKAALRYDASTGTLFWRVRPRSISAAKFAVDPRAAWDAGDGYLRVGFNGKSYLAHRLIWKMATGVDADMIDHIDGNKANNALSNLRAVNRSQNSRNAKMYSTNTSGVVGVFETPYGRWLAYISVDGIRRNLGTFGTKEEAAEARFRAAAKLGFSQRHGKAA